MPSGYPGMPAEGSATGAPAGVPADYPGMVPEGSSTGVPAGVPANYPGGSATGLIPPAGSGSSADGVGPPNPDAAGGYPGAGDAQAQQPPKPLTFADKAGIAFQQGREKDGLQYVYAHALTGDDAVAKEVLGQMGWVGPLKKPAMTVRWGIAIEYVFNGPRGYTGNLYPIGTAQNVATKGGGGGAGIGGQPQPGGMGDGGFAPGGMGGAGQGNASLQNYTGELGQKVLQQLQQRIAKGDFGKVLALAGKTSTPGATPGMPGAAAGMPGAGMPEGSGTNLGAGMPGGAAPGGVEGAGMPGQPLGGRPTDVSSLSPGIVLLGVVSPRDLRDKAQAAGVDVICVFDVSVTPNPRTGLILNETAIRLHNTVEPKELWESRKLNNIKVQIERADPKGDQDPADREIEALFKKVDADWHVGPLPSSLTAANVLDRLRLLISQTHENPLPVLAEVRMYQTRGLLKDEHLLTAYQKLIGESGGTQLATGSEEEKKQAIETWLPSES